MRFLWPVALCFTALMSFGAEAHELGHSDIYFQISGTEEKIETNELEIDNVDIDDYIYLIKIKSKEHSFTNGNVFHKDGGKDPHFSAINYGSYCGVPVFFITLRADGPKMADSLVSMIYTHVFRTNTLGYLASVGGTYEEITPLEKGVDIGYPYTMPQRYLVECKPATATTPFQFSFTDRAPGFRGFGDGE